MSVVVLAGGVGAARFLHGLLSVVDPETVTAIVNTGDDTVLHGLSISPDLDTITYTLADAIDPDRGWGLAGETWTTMDALERYAQIRPDDSDAAPCWFNLGDRDLATHMYRTARLAESATLTEVTDEIRRAWALPCSVLPMTDQRRSTVIDTVDHGEISFQDYFVRLGHSVAVQAVRFDGEAELSATARTALERADTIVIAPSNPLVSIGPIRSLSGVDDILAERRDRVVAVSPIVGGVALKGPADRMLVELGHDASVAGVAALYSPVASALVIDPVDADHAAGIGTAGMEAVVTPSVMSTPAIARELARATLAAVS